MGVRGQGEILSFERAERYLAKRIRIALPRNAGRLLCAAFGLDIFNEQFYGPRWYVVSDDRSDDSRETD